MLGSDERVEKMNRFGERERTAMARSANFVRLEVLEEVVLATVLIDQEGEVNLGIGDWAVTSNGK